MGIVQVFKRLREDVDSVMQRDPAARSRLAVLLCYPGIHALVFYRLGHRLWRAGWYTLALVVAAIGRRATGIEIHPAARIGRRFFIDHGNGVVVGETAEIGDDVTLYQQVTLGGTSLNAGKRHPTLGNGVIVGAGAKILGPFRVGDHARVGSNAVVIAEVPDGVTVVGIPAKAAMPKSKEAPRFVAYGTPCENLPDPVAQALRGLRDEVSALRIRLDAAESALAEVEQGRALNPSVHGAAPGAAANGHNGHAAMVDGLGA